jgi:DNA-binding protein YbaB
MKRWLDTFLKKLVVRGRQGMKMSVIVAVHRGTVWVSIDPLFAFDAILEPEHVASLIDMLTQAVKEAQGYRHDDVS